MLKKSDLAKQFELVVKQEIKNYQDSLNFVLQSIDELKKGLKEAKDDVLESHAASHSEPIRLGIEIQTIKEETNKSIRQIHRLVGDQTSLNETNRNILSNALKEALSKFNEINVLPDKFHDLWNHVNFVSKKLEEYQRGYSENLMALQSRVKKDIQKSKEEILSAPSESSIVRKDLEDQIASHKVDVSGIMRELTIVKHDAMVSGKKIENIYTLIERLKRG